MSVALPASAVLALILGTSLYLVDRDWASTLFLSPWAGFQGAPSGVFGPLGLVLPSFLHAYAFALLLILMLGRSTFARRLGAVAWFVVAAGLELLQAIPVHASATGFATSRVESTFLSSIQSYVASGHFDPADLCAAGVGCLAAYIVSSALEVGK